MKLAKLRALVLLCTFAPAWCFGATLGLNDFLKQVLEKNRSMRGSEILAMAADLRADEGKLIFRPSIFASAQTTVDKKPTTNVNAQGDRTDFSLLSAGFIQAFPVGLQAKLSYNVSHTKIYHASPAFLPINDYKDGVAAVEFTQSLWRNFWGKELKAQETIALAQAQASKHSENYKIKATLAQAEALYWSLSQMRKIVKVQKESLERAQKIRSWSQNRFKSGLGDQSDFLQADANFKAREYELKSSTQELKNLARAANALREVDAEIFDEELEAVDGAKIKSLTLPPKAEFKDDTKMAMELEKIARATAELSIEKRKPTLELFGSYALNGRDPDVQSAVGNSFNSTHDTKTIGVRFVAPLDFLTTYDTVKGYQQEKIAAGENYQRKLFEQEQGWNDLVSKFEDAQIKLSLIEKIEEAQKAKSTHERDRLNKGRTVTFQVLNFEQDFAQSELARIQSETAILNIYAQLKIYSAGGIQ